MKKFFSKSGKGNNEFAGANEQTAEVNQTGEQPLEGQIDAPVHMNNSSDPVESLERSQTLKAADIPNGPAAPKGKKAKKPWSRKKKIIVFSILGVLVAAIAGVSIYVAALYNDPMSAFAKVADQISASPSASGSTSSSAPQSSSAAPASTDPYDKLKNQADTSMLKDIVNILLIGVDHADERDAWKGKKAFHADVMIILAINTKTNEVNMISIPRDTWVEMPGVKGYYKANACVDCGGGWPTKENPTDGGFKKACELATWMLGGDIPVQYYYAVDMGAVKGLVDAIGGVDYDLDITFDLMGRKYTKGQQHMNGQAVLDYLRVRKGGNIDDSSGEIGDLHRIERQKKMLVAIFEKIKQQDLLVKLPDILNTFDGNLYTNTNFAQTAGLALFMKNVDAAKIEMNAFEGTYDTLFFDLRFVFTSQNKRIALIQKIYGQKVAAAKCTHTLAVSRWANMRKSTILKKVQSVLTKADSILEADINLPVYTPPTDGSPVPSKTPKGYRKYGTSVHDLYSQCVSEHSSLDSKSGQELLDAEDALIADVAKLCGKLGITVPSYTVNDKSYNEIDVDPR